MVGPLRLGGSLYCVFAIHVVPVLVEFLLVAVIDSLVAGGGLSWAKNLA